MTRVGGGTDRMVGMRRPGLAGRGGVRLLLSRRAARLGQGD